MTTDQPVREYWSAPEIWADDTVFIVGGGPSLLGMDLSPIHHRPVLGVNNAFMLGPWVDVTFFGDKAWWEFNRRRLMRHPCLIVTNNTWDYFGRIGRVKQMERDNRKGLWWRSKSKLCWNNNSGAAAINLAFLFGASKIVLLGFDMRVDKEEKGKRSGHNWHDEHRNKVPEDSIYADRFIPGMKRIRADLDMLNSNGRARNVEVLNATPDSALDAFVKVDFDKALQLPQNH